MLDKLVKKTIHLSLFIQILTTFVALDGFNKQLLPNDEILKDILWIETIVQIIEGVFYVWIIYSLKDLNKMTSRRYIDWSITTPIMLLSTIIYFKYTELKEKGTLEPFTAWDFYESNKENIHKIFLYNGLMLLCGFLSEINLIDKRIGIPLGFYFFYLSFNLIYTEYGIKTELGTQLFTILLGLWSLYGFAAILPVQQKNISYNILDIFAKNFYGLYIYYRVKQLQINV
tara:strand:+ start:627 stop:1313 length:687 start_codon:yes stop_codon:yes gene_type:complete